MLESSTSRKCSCEGRSSSLILKHLTTRINTDEMGVRLPTINSEIVIDMCGQAGSRLRGAVLFIYCTIERALFLGLGVEVFSTRVPPQDAVSLGQIYKDSTCPSLHIVS
jgi:hypothetical protein